jgi:hypothetical protein
VDRILWTADDATPLTFDGNLRTHKEVEHHAGNNKAVMVTCGLTSTHGGVKEERRVIFI